MSDVPFFNLDIQHRALEAELAEAVLPLLRTAGFVGGPPVDRFEEAFAGAHDIEHAVSLKSGTSALQLALEALGITHPEDEVLVPAFTFIATGASVVRAGAKPVFVDVDDENANLDPEAVRKAITPRTKAMIPVHLYGHPAPMGPLMEIAREHGIRVLEDCAQSHLSTLDGRVTGTFGDIAAFSFYPSKNLGAGGDGGAVITRDAELADHVRRLANHGRIDRYHHGFLGWNERMDSIQAAILAVKLGHLPGWNRKRREDATRYHQLLQGVAPFGKPLRLPAEQPGAEPVYHLYVTRHPERDRLAEALAERGVGTATHYPTTLPAQPAFRALGLGDAEVPRSEAWARDCLSLPFFPEMTVEQQEQVAVALQELG